MIILYYNIIYLLKLINIRVYYIYYILLKYNVYNKKNYLLLIKIIK